MSREFDPAEVEELIKQAFRLVPRSYWQDNDTFPSDIQTAIRFVGETANGAKSISADDELRDKLAAEAMGALLHEYGTGNLTAEKLKYAYEIADMMLEARRS